MTKQVKTDKDIREESMMELLESLFLFAGNKLSELERNVLKDVLSGNKTFKDVAKLRGQNEKRQRFIFNYSLKKLLNHIKPLNQSLLEYKKIKRELSKSKEQITILEERMGQRSKLSDGAQILLTVPIDKTDLPARVKKTCGYENIRLVSDLVSITRTEFLRMRNCGAKGAEDVERFFNAHGLSWGMKV